MKKLLISFLLVVFSISSYGQCASVINGSKNSRSLSYKYHDNPVGHWYISGAIDLNNALDMDKSSEPKGWDFDVELGVRSYSTAFYFYYGEFKKLEYTNYGVGLERFILSERNLDISLGMNVGVLTRERHYLTDDISYFAYAPRIKTTFGITDEIGLFVVGQYQHRPDRDIHGVFEVQAGIQLYIN